MNPDFKEEVFIQKPCLFAWLEGVWFNNSYRFEIYSFLNSAFDIASNRVEMFTKIPLPVCNHRSFSLAIDRFSAVRRTVEFVWLLENNSS